MDNNLPSGLSQSDRRHIGAEIDPLDYDKENTICHDCNQPFLAGKSWMHSQCEEMESCDDDNSYDPGEDKENDDD